MFLSAKQAVRQNDVGIHMYINCIIRKTKCSGATERNVSFRETKRTFLNLFLFPTSVVHESTGEHTSPALSLVARLAESTSLAIAKDGYVSCHEAVQSLS